MLTTLLDHRASARQIDLLLLVLRVFYGVILVWGVQDNVFHREHMEAFTKFVEQNGFPAPVFSAYLSAYAQFIAGLMIALGFLTRFAAAVMAINFIVALAMVHVGLPFSANIPPLSMLCLAVLLVIGGPGMFSVDAKRHSAA